jgi:hypothetical protein
MHCDWIEAFPQQRTDKNAFWRVEVGDFYSVRQEATLGPDTEWVISQMSESDSLVSEESY